MSPYNTPMNNLRVCIIGLGLIGGSFAAALKQAGFRGHIQAVVRSTATAKLALAQGLVDAVTEDAVTAVADADVILLSVPMLAMRGQLEMLHDRIKPTAIVTDAGSVKSCFIADAQAVFGTLKRIVPGHPIAGREKSGLTAADASLFQDRRVLLTPGIDTDVEAVAIVAKLWQLTGALVEQMDPGRHDRVLAATSHLPHVVAFALVDTLATEQEAEEIFRYAAGGFRDFTRIASSDAIMWRDICLCNRDALCAAMDALDVHLKRLRKAIEHADADTIEQTFRRARAARDNHT